MATVSELQTLLAEARQWVESTVAPVRELSPAAAAPGQELLTRIDQALAAAPSCCLSQGREAIADRLRDAFPDLDHEDLLCAAETAFPECLGVQTSLQDVGVELPEVLEHIHQLITGPDPEASWHDRKNRVLSLIRNWRYKIRSGDKEDAVESEPRLDIGAPFMTAHSGGEDGPYIRLKYSSMTEMQDAHTAICDYFSRTYSGTFTERPSSPPTHAAPLDPDYARIYTKARCLAWQEGYALVLHGSATRDLDLLAVPWAEEACDPDHLVRRITAAESLRTVEGSPTARPHGRHTWTLLLPEFGDPRFVDLSVLSPAPSDFLQEQGTALMETALRLVAAEEACRTADTKTRYVLSAMQACTDETLLREMSAQRRDLDARAMEAVRDRQDATEQALEVLRSLSSKAEN